MQAHGQMASEAQSCGTPCVAFENTGLSDVIAHNQTGLLATYNSSSSLMDKIHKLVTDTQLRLRLSQAARKRAVDSWSSDVIGSELASIYNHILSQSLSV